MSATLEADARPTSTVEVYSWASGHTPPVSAVVFKRAWDALAVKLGHTPSAAELVQAARDPDHVLHACFDWDVAAAAAAHWVDTARLLIRHLRVTYEQGPVRHMPMRALFQVQIGGARQYIDSRTALVEPDMRDQIMREALRDIRAFCGKYRVFLTAIGAEAQAAALDRAIVQAMVQTP